MIHKRIPNSTHVFTAPDCYDLQVRAVPTEDGGVLCESAWELMPDEIETLKNGGYLVLSIYGRQPPVKLYVEKASEDPHDKIQA